MRKTCFENLISPLIALLLIPIGLSSKQPLLIHKVLGKLDLIDGRKLYIGDYSKNNQSEVSQKE